MKQEDFMLMELYKYINIRFSRFLMSHSIKKCSVLITDSLIKIKEDVVGK